VNYDEMDGDRLRLPARFVSFAQISCATWSEACSIYKRRSKNLGGASKKFFWWRKTR